MVIANEQIRAKAKAAKVPLWRIGAELGVCEQTILRWMRTTLSKEKEQAVLAAIEKLTMEGK